MFSDSWTVNYYQGAVHIVLVPEAEEPGGHDQPRDHMRELLERRDIFFFDWGCVVFWGTSQEEERGHLEAAYRFLKQKSPVIEMDDLLFRYGDHSSIRHDVVTLITIDAREKLSLSFAMAQSVKLDLFESRVEQVIEEYRSIPSNMKSNMNRVLHKLSQRDLSKMIGKIFLERADINLNSEILDEPDYFWESDEWLPMYETMMSYLEVDSRVSLLNSKLDILKELVGVLNNQVQQRHGVRLEWIVIW